MNEVARHIAHAVQRGVNPGEALYAAAVARGWKANGGATKPKGKVSKAAIEKF